MFIGKKKLRVFVPMKIAICDDNHAFVQQLCQLIRNYSALNDWICEYSLFTSPDKLLNSNLDGVHVVFLDIDMPGINGIEAASILRKRYPELIIVFVTAFIEYAPAGYCVEAFRYLLKPCITSELPACLDAIKQKLYDTQESISVALIAIQIVSLLLKYPVITAYSCLALMFTVMAVLLEFFIMEGDAQIMKAFDKIASKMVQGITIMDEYGWPPVCSGLFYQPERPVADIADNPSENAPAEAVR